VVKVEEEVEAKREAAGKTAVSALQKASVFLSFLAAALVIVQEGIGCSIEVLAGATKNITYVTRFFFEILNIFGYSAQKRGTLKSSERKEQIFMFPEVQREGNDHLGFKKKWHKFKELERDDTDIIYKHIKVCEICGEHQDECERLAYQHNSVHHEFNLHEEGGCIKCGYDKLNVLHCLDDDAMDQHIYERGSGRPYFPLPHVNNMKTLEKDDLIEIEKDQNFEFSNWTSMWDDAKKRAISCIEFFKAKPELVAFMLLVALLSAAAVALYLSPALLESFMVQLRFGSREAKPRPMYKALRWKRKDKRLPKKEGKKHNRARMTSKWKDLQAYLDDIVKTTPKNISVSGWFHDHDYDFDAYMKGGYKGKTWENDRNELAKKYKAMTGKHYDSDYDYYSNSEEELAREYDDYEDWLSRRKIEEEDQNRKNAEFRGSRAHIWGDTDWAHSSSSSREAGNIVINTFKYGFSRRQCWDFVWDYNHNMIAHKGAPLNLSVVFLLKVDGRQMWTWQPVESLGCKAEDDSWAVIQVASFMDIYYDQDDPTGFSKQKLPSSWTREGKKKAKKRIEEESSSSEEEVVEKKEARKRKKKVEKSSSGSEELPSKKEAKIKQKVVGKCSKCEEVMSAKALRNAKARGDSSVCFKCSPKSRCWPCC
jgi:hypothetical protein